MTPVSLNPETYSEGGAVPVDRNLTWEKVRFNLFDYKTKAGEVVATTVALRVNYKEDDGTEHEQQYSVGDPARFTVAEDGKTIEPAVAGTAMAKSCNAAILLNELVNCGFAASRLESGDVSLLEGLKTFNIGMPEPVRSGLKREAPVEGQPAYPKVISVPSKILVDPGDAKGGTKTSVAGPDPAIVAAAVSAVAKVIDADGATDRKKLVTKILADLAKDPNKNAIAKAVFAEGFDVELMAAGYSLEGETISKL